MHIFHDIRKAAGGYEAKIIADVTIFKSRFLGISSAAQTLILIKYDDIHMNSYNIVCRTDFIVLLLQPETLESSTKVVKLVRACYPLVDLNPYDGKQNPKQNECCFYPYWKRMSLQESSKNHTISYDFHMNLYDTFV